MKKALFISLCVLLLAGTGCKKNAEPDAGSNQGDIFLFGGKFAIDPRTYTNAGTTNPSGNTHFIIGEGYSVKENTEEDKDEFPYIVSKD